MTTKRETVLSALEAVLAAIPDVAVKRNAERPNRIDPDGLLILRDGDPGDPEASLSPLRWHYEHLAEVEVYVQAATEADRTAKLDVLLAAIGSGLAADRTLGGVADYVMPLAPTRQDDAEIGAPGVSAALLNVAVHYTTTDPLEVNPMAITRGADAALVTKFESTFGTFATGDFDLRPFLTWTAGAEEEVVRPSIIDGVRDPEAPIAGVYNLTGDAEVPLDVRNIGFWFKATFGDPVTTGTGPYTHTFKSGAESIPTFSAELGVSSATTFLQMTGLCVNSMRLGWQPSSGSPSATFGLLGKDETKEATSGGGTPAEAALTRFSRFHGAITRNASPLGEVLEAELTYGNNLEGLFFVGQGRSVSAIKLGGADFGGSITVRYESATLFDDAVAGTPVNLGLSYSIDASNKLTFSLPNVTLPKPRLEVRGPGGIDVTYQLFPSRQSDGSEAMTVTLVNDVESY